MLFWLVSVIVNNCSLFLYILFGFFIFEYWRFTCRKSILLPLLGDSSLLRLFLAKRSHDKPYFCVFCNLPIVTTMHNDRGGRNLPTTRTKTSPESPKSPINIGFEGFNSCIKQQSHPAMIKNAAVATKSNPRKYRKKPRKFAYFSRKMPKLSHRNAIILHIVF